MIQPKTLRSEVLAILDEVIRRRERFVAVVGSGGWGGAPPGPETAMPRSLAGAGHRKQTAGQAEENFDVRNIGDGSGVAKGADAQTALQCRRGAA